MLGSAVRSFQDPWEHQEFFRAADMTVLVTSRGEYRSTLTRIDLHRLWMQRNDTVLPQIAHVASHKSRNSIGFVLDGGPIYRDGTEVLPDTIVVSSPDSDCHLRMQDASNFGTMSLSPEELAAASRAIIGRELTAPSATRYLRPSDHLMSRLRDLHRAACHLAATAPDILAHPEVARAIEDAAVRAMVHSLATQGTVADHAPGHQRAPIMRRFERAVSETPHEPLYLAEVCAAIGVGERTLRNHCLHHLGMSPHRYLWLRRMNQARRALTLADPAATTVTVIANDHGFWELGRFAVAYRQLFGETPSTTLRRAPDQGLTAADQLMQKGRLPILP
jgi:AraC-like DNA-binding protein